MTLNELARKLREVFNCNYVTVEYNHGLQQIVICLWRKNGPSSPVFNKKEMGWFNRGDSPFEFTINEKSLRIDLNLSEYRDADGKIDYSKCIVEVE